MRSFPNIEKSGFHKGQYVGYAAGMVWRIKKTNSSYGAWCARPNELNHPEGYKVASVYAFRLSDMSDKLAALKESE